MESNMGPHPGTHVFCHIIARNFQIRGFLRCKMHFNIVENYRLRFWVILEKT